jgi:hypothetical protein
MRRITGWLHRRRASSSSPSCAGGGNPSRLSLYQHREQRRREEIDAIDRSSTHSHRIGTQPTRSPSPRHGRDPGCVAAQEVRPADNRPREEARRQHGTCLAAVGNKAPGAGAGAGELAGVSWRRIAGRPSPARPRQGDAAGTSLSSVSPPLHLMARLKVGELLLPLILRSCCLP